MINKKGQAAMEFLMTYGWAIMIVLIVIAALFFLGVFNPSTPSNCNLPAPFVCQDVALTNVAGIPNSHYVKLKIASTGIDSATIRNIKITTSCSNAAITVDGVTTQNIVNSRTQPVTVSCILSDASLSVGSKAAGSFEIVYTKQFGLPHTIAGTFSGTIEPA